LTPRDLDLDGRYEATEEASVVAAASTAARIARIRNGFFTSSTRPIMQAQVQVDLGTDDFGYSA
jgi:hydroxymethylglutaryl-CoA reductase